MLVLRYSCTQISSMQQKSSNTLLAPLESLKKAAAGECAAQELAGSEMQIKRRPAGLAAFGILCSASSVIT